MCIPRARDRVALDGHVIPRSGRRYSVQLLRPFGHRRRPAHQVALSEWHAELPQCRQLCFRLHGGQDAVLEIVEQVIELGLAFDERTASRVVPAQTRQLAAAALEVSLSSDDQFGPDPHTSTVGVLARGRQWPKVPRSSLHA